MIIPCWYLFLEQAKRNLQVRNAEQVAYQIETPKRKKAPQTGGFATPSANRGAPSSDFRTPKTSSQPKTTEIVYKTPLGDVNGRKKRGFKTPKLTLAAEERKIVAAKKFAMP